jgi:hypothetical protein
MLERLQVGAGKFVLYVDPHPEGEFVRANEAQEEIDRLNAQYDSLREATMQAYGALVGSSASPESVQGLAKARLKTVLGFDRSQVEE